MTILLYLVLASCAFSLGILAWGCLLAWRRSRASRGRHRHGPGDLAHPLL